MLRLKGKRANREEPFTDATGEDSDTSKEQGGRPVEMLYSLDEARLMLATNDKPSHTALSDLGFSVSSVLLMNGLVHN